MGIEALASAAVLVFAVLLATLVEGAVEIVVGQALSILLRDYATDHPIRAWAGYGLQIFSIGVGIALIFTTSLDLVGFAAEICGFEIMPAVSRSITGFIVGRGASYVHDIFGLISGQKKKANGGVA